ncbi:hypothetical protein PFLUV_G00093140 [Perca fluviatilis]|uniref:Uncharacterized protein n=1 Tax=Perca fluviatilis TaxID=8168 RepID=A0A6A5EAV7_PERFL|nr:hypothetical protein PFLUV_G00093140 [Perca fluviatilis]
MRLKVAEERCQNTFHFRSAPDVLKSSEGGETRNMAANTYRMTDRDITRMIQLRATNTSIFTGKRNSAMRGWRSVD